MDLGDSDSDVPDTDPARRFSTLRRRYSETDLSTRALLPIHQLLRGFPIISAWLEPAGIDSVAPAASGSVTVLNPRQHSRSSLLDMNPEHYPQDARTRIDKLNLRSHIVSTGDRGGIVQSLSESTHIVMQRNSPVNVPAYPPIATLASSERPEYAASSARLFNLAPGSGPGPSSNRNRQHHSQTTPIGYERQVDRQFTASLVMTSSHARSGSPDTYFGTSRGAHYQESGRSPGSTVAQTGSSLTNSFESMHFADQNDPYITRPNPHHSSSFPLFQRRATFSAESALPVRSRTLPAEQWTPDYDEIVPKTPAIRKTAAKTSAPIHQSFHPKPPDKPSDFSMWVGNLPKLVSQDELWIFFTQGAAALPHSISNTTSGLLSANTIYHGVLSIFLISKTNCAFVDYATEAHRNHATALFDGKPLRAGDARCPKLICRARRKEDELTAGVGAQRGSGIHRRWVAEQQMQTTNLSPTEWQKQPLSRAMVQRLDQSSDHSARALADADGAETSSEASTTSSFLMSHFPSRYFILKALVQSDLEASVQSGTWRTQPHNEDVLEKAFRTSRNVFLIFSVNKSGEFFGYARMSGNIPPRPINDDGIVDKLGRPFPVQWICTQPVSFFRTRHLRNPWNRGREVKISRDGMELEVSLGQLFLQEYLELSAKPDTRKGHH